MKNNHTAQNLTNGLKISIDDWTLNDKVVAFVHNNARSITNAVNMIKKRYRSCCFSAHTI